MNQVPIETKDVTSTGLLNTVTAISARAAERRYGPPLAEFPAVRAGAAR